MLDTITHIILDAARLGVHMNEFRFYSRNPECLYTGNLRQSLKEVAPYLAQAKSGTSFTNWYLKKGWGDSWGVGVRSSWPVAELSNHFRKFILVKTEEGNNLYFRFYDPRVLRLFLPTCDAAQIREFFGDAVQAFILEDEDPAFALRYRHENGILKTERIPVTEFIKALPDPEPLPPVEEEPLPPETLAYLKEQGLLTPEMAAESAPAAEAAKTTTTNETAAPQATEPGSAKPKTKWDMFD